MFRWAVMIAFFGLAFAVRAADIMLPGIYVSEGDWDVYSRVASNMLNGCGVSMSGPGAACVAHFGGNGLPGYPAFIAVVWVVFGVGKAPVLWAQACLASLAIPRLAHAADQLGGKWAMLCCGGVAALSPLEALLVRYGLAECLTVATATWLLAELMVSLVHRRLRVVAVGIPVAIAIFLRLDSILFLIPVAIVGLWLHGLWRAAVRGMALAAVIGMPLGIWTVRNIMQNVPASPPAKGWMLPDGTVGPLGYMSWLKQWVTDPDERSSAAFFSTNRYELIHFLPSPFRPPADEAAAEALLADLKTHTGQPFPATIDAAFAVLARDIAARRSWTETMELRALQGLVLWRSWIEILPKEVRPDGQISLVLVASWAFRALTQSAATLLSTVARFYRLALGLMFLGMLSLTLVRPRLSWQAPATPLVLGSAAIVIAKTVLAVSGLFIEARYTTTVIPFIETTTGLTLATDFARRREMIAEKVSILQD